MNLSESETVATKARKSGTQVFTSIPVDPEHYAQDIRPFIAPIIETHGMEEWVAGVLTNEIHGHVGIYALLGMKMGLRAMEYFGTGRDELFIRSEAGQKPPLSCLNDGLQVSTGASLGHGQIEADKNPDPKPAAIFIRDDEQIRIVLKDEVAIQIKSEVGYGVGTYGTSSAKYWEYIRQLAINYWLELDRNKIFIISRTEQ